MKYVTQSYNSAQFGIDVDGNLWLLIAPCYSPNISRSGLGRMTYSSYERTQMIDFPKNAYFDLFEIEDMSISAMVSIGFKAFIYSNSSKLLIHLNAWTNLWAYRFFNKCIILYIIDIFKHLSYSEGPRILLLDLRKANWYNMLANTLR